MLPRRQDAFPRPGQRWAHFEITGEVARGNMGVVYRARGLQDRRDVALKVLIVGHDDREACERFKREARSLARLSSRHIVSVHSYGVHEGIPFLTMDFVPGATLQELFDRGALPLSRAVDLLARIAHAMDHAHSRGVLHRDLKPANVLIGADGEPRITDFGLARLDDASASLTHDGDLIGTPVYMAPEQIRGDVRALGPCSDVWALGVMLYVALTGALPFPGRTVDEVSRRVTGEEPAPPRARRPDVPADLERICLAALIKDHKLRYQSAGELARDLEAYLRGRPVLAGRVTVGVRARRAGRAVRLHAGALGVVLAASVLVGGVAVGRHLVASSRVERSTAELLVRAVNRRAAAQVAVDEALADWSRRDGEGTAEHARHALDEVAWAAAYLERAARTVGMDAEALRLDEALGGAPASDEVRLGLARDPVLARLHVRGRALLARAADAHEVHEAARAVAAWGWLDAGFRATGDLADLEALAAAAERLGSVVPARLARAALDAAGAAPDAAIDAPIDADDEDQARRLALRARLGALGATAACPCGGAGPARWTCDVCDHACGADPAQGPCGACGIDAAARGRDDARGVAAREAFARAALRRGRPQGASLRPGDDALLRAEVARALERPAEHRVALAPLLAAGSTRAAPAWVERARGLLADGFPRAAREAAARARAAAPTDRDVLAQALAVDGGAQAAMGEPDLALRALARDPQAPVVARLEAARLLALTGASDDEEDDEDDDGDGEDGDDDGGRGDADDREPGAVVAEPTAPLRRARARLRLARAAGAVADAVGRLALRAEGLAAHEPSPLPRALDLGALEGDARALGSGEALAAVAALRLARDASPARGLELARAAPDDGSAPDVVLRLAGSPRAARPTGASGRAGPSAPLVEGRAWLSEPEDDTAARLRARRALELAVRLDPFAAAPYVARSALRLRAAGQAEDDGARRALALGALQDGAAAAAIEPGDAAARAAFLVALAVVAPEQLPRRLDGAGPPLAPGELAALRRAAEARAPRPRPEWATPTDPDDHAALRLLAVILAARGDAAPARPEALRLADALRRRLDDAPSTGLERDLLHAGLLLEDPTELDPWLLHRRWTAADAELEAALDGARGVEARVVTIVAALTRLPPGAAPEGLARERARGLALLEDVARRRPGPTVAALRAAIEVWTGAPTLERRDLLAHTWPGTLREVLRAAEGEVGVGRDGLWEHHAVRRLLATR